MIDPRFVTTAFELPGCRTVRTLGIVRGIVVRSRSIVGPQSRVTHAARRRARTGRGDRLYPRLIASQVRLAAPWSL